MYAPNQFTSTRNNVFPKPVYFKPPLGNFNGFSGPATIYYFQYSSETIPYFILKNHAMAGFRLDLAKANLLFVIFSIFGRINWRFYVFSGDTARGRRPRRARQGVFARSRLDLHIDSDNSGLWATLGWPGPIYYLLFQLSSVGFIIIFWSFSDYGDEIPLRSREPHLSFVILVIFR